MAATYPSTLPGPEREGLSVPVGDHVQVTPVQGGSSIRKRIKDQYLIRQSLTFVFDETQFNTWGLFVQDTLAFIGSFNLTTFGLDGIAEREVWLSKGKYDASPIDNGKWIVECEINYIQSTVLDDCSINIVDSGTASSVPTDIIDGGTAPTPGTDTYDGGVA